MGDLSAVAGRVSEAVEFCSQEYYKLALLVGPAGSGKTAVLKDLAARTSAAYCNLGIELARHLLELSRRERASLLPVRLAEIAESLPTDVVLLDNVEILFEPSLRTDPLGVLRRLSRMKTLVASWPGRVERKDLLYAKSGHPEYKRYHSAGVAVVEIYNDGSVGVTLREMVR